jgi:hypothetical protein
MFSLFLCSKPLCSKESSGKIANENGYPLNFNIIHIFKFSLDAALNYIRNGRGKFYE